MDAKHNIEEQLWNFIDGNLSANEKAVVEKLVKTDTAWKTKYHELLEISEALHASGLDSPSMRFTKNVMEEIAKLHIAPAAKSYINKKIIWGLAFFFITLIVGFLIYGFAQMDWSSGSSDTNITKNLDKLDFSKFFNNNLVNVFMMINIILGLFLLDNFLAGKRKKYREEA